MKRYILNSYFVLLCFVLQAQVNLVPNYSFEDYNTCPNNTPGNILNSKYWINGNNNGTSDYYNSCVTTFPYYFWVPKNFPGYQFAKTGNAYVGIGVFGGPNFVGQIEYAQTKLIDSLKPNKHYCVQYFVSRADSMGDYGISNFGALFTNTIVSSNDPYNIQMIPQVKNPVGRIIMDKLGWTSISGTYTAVGGEKHITLGNFDPKSAIDTIFDPVHPSIPLGIYDGIYYYIDDVTVEDVVDAQAGNDKLIICGDSVVLGADSAIGAYYKWTPSIGLSNDSVAFPIAQPTITTTYVLRKQQCHIVTYDTVQVAVNGICPVGINELINDYNIKVYPTPTDEEFMIEFNLNRSKQNLTLTIYNIIGELVKKQNLQNGISKIDVSDLKSGTYLYRISIDDNEVKKDKLIIIK